VIAPVRLETTLAPFDLLLGLSQAETGLLAKEFDRFDRSASAHPLLDRSGSGCPVQQTRHLAAVEPVGGRR